MPLTDEQIELRRHGITATDVAKILGLNPWSGPMDVLQDKLGNAPPFRGTARTRIGERLEPGIRQDFEEAHGVEVAVPGTIIHPSEPWAMATPDGLMPDAGLEIKVVGERRAPDWGEPGTDQVPRYVYPQCTWSMFICDRPKWYVVAKIDLEDYEFVLRRDVDLEERVVARCREFWLRHVVDGEPLRPDGSASYSREIAKRFRSHGPDLVRPSPADVERMGKLRQVLADMAALQKQEQRLRQEIQLAIAEHAGIETGDGKRVTWRRSKDRIYTDWEVVAAEQRILLDLLIAKGGAAKDELLESMQRFGIEDLGDIHANHTAVREGTRRFCVPRSWDRPKR